MNESKNNALAIYGQFDQIQRAACALQESGYFADSKTKAQAIAKVMAGAEIGIAPFASMTGIHIIQGKPTLGANLIATLIKNDPRYDYHIEELNDKACRIKFFENGKEAGESKFDIEDAKKAGTQNMGKFPRNMMFARAMSNGAKWYCAGVFGGMPIYTPEELGAEVDEDGFVLTESEVVAESKPFVEQSKPAETKPQESEQRAGFINPAQVKRLHTIGSGQPVFVTKFLQHHDVESGSAKDVLESRYDSICQELDITMDKLRRIIEIAKLYPTEAKVELSAIELTSLKDIELSQIDPALRAMNLLNARKEDEKHPQSDATEGDEDER